MSENTIMITGDTWSWKTYHALKNYPWSFAYLAPCKQLVYEVFQDYGNKNTHLHTWDVHLKGAENFMWTYEAFSVDQVKDFDRIIIDEFHYFADYERWGHLKDIIDEAKKQNKLVLWLTATPNLDESILHAYAISKLHLKAWKKVPDKKEIEYEQFLENARNWASSIYFSKYTPSEYTKAEFVKLLWINEDQIAILSASDTGMERIRVQNGFRNGSIRFLICTNVLAQWLNFPTTNVAIEYNEWDGREVIDQKLWRLGRPSFSDGVDEVYYALHYKPDRSKHKKLKHKELMFTNHTDISPDLLSNNYHPHEMITRDRLCWWYREFKYCYNSVKELIETKNYYEDETLESLLYSAFNFLEDDRKKLAKFLRWVHL